jgi:drug/metabolite transporter (DMT)-like permease
MQAAAILFFAGLPLLIFLQWKLDLWSSRNLRHQNRNVYAIACGVLFVAVFLLIFRSDARELGLAVGLATVLTLLAAWWVNKYYGKTVRGHKLVVARRSKIKQVVIVAGTVIGVMVFGRMPVGRNIMEWHWLILGAAMAWPLTTVYAYIHVSRLEHSLGHALEESPPNE